MSALFRHPAVIGISLVALGTGIWAVTTAYRGEPRQEISGNQKISQKASPSSKASTLKKITLTRDYGNAILTLKITLHNPTPKPQLLAPPFVRLTDSTKSEIPAFFPKFAKPDALEPGEKETHELSFWLEDSHLLGQLWLLVHQTKILVKDTEAFDIARIENQKSRTFNGPNWR